MSSIFDSKYADKYENNKYIWENETDKNSPAAVNAAKENAEIRELTGTAADTMDYDTYRNKRAIYSDYYGMANSVAVNPQYKAESDRLYNRINNFKYNAEDDPAYTAYVNAAKRGSQSAQKTTYANMTAASGGRNNSYAAAATAQVGQAYSDKINDYATTLANEAYNKLVEKYKLSNDRYKQAVSEANSEYDKYMKLGDADVENKRRQLEDEREVQKFKQQTKQNELDYKQGEQDYKQSLLDYEIDLDNFKSQLIKNNILNEKNQYEFERWKQDPNYEIKDKKLAEAIGDYMGYSWLKSNGRDYLYSKLY